jgi:excisionase family DNA binding protein
MSTLEKVPVAEAAQRLGISIDTVKRRIASGKLSGTRDNRGYWLVDLPPDNSEAAHPAQAPIARMRAAAVTARDEENELTAQLRSQIQDLKAQLEKTETDRAAWEARFLAADERHRTEMLAERAAAAEERAKLLDLIQTTKTRRRWWPF